MAAETASRAEASSAAPETAASKKTASQTADKTMPFHLRLVAEMHGHQDRVWQVSWSPVSPLLLSASSDRSVRVWKPASATATQPAAAPTTAWECVAIADDAHSRTVRSVAFNPDGRIFATGSFDATVGIWDRLEGNALECTTTLEGHENEVKSVAWAASGALLATCSRDKSVWIWEVIGNEEFECCCVLQEHTQDVKMVQWHPEEEILASASYDDTIKIWREEDSDWYCADTLTGHGSTVWAIDFDRTGRMLASVSDDKSLRIWRQSETDTKYHPYAVAPDFHTRAIYSVTWSKHHGRIATSSSDNTIKICHVVDGNGNNGHQGRIEVLAELKDPHGLNDINSVVWCPIDEQSALLASAGDDGVVRIWSLEENVDQMED